jgi:hypothetical protein
MTITITRSTQQVDVIYLVQSGEAFYSPDGEGRVWFDTLEDALAETGITWVQEVNVDPYEL